MAQNFSQTITYVVSIIIISVFSVKKDLINSQDEGRREINSDFKTDSVKKRK